MTLHPSVPPFKTPPEEADAIDAKVSVWQMQARKSKIRLRLRIKLAGMICEGQRMAAFIRSEAARIK